MKEFTKFKLKLFAKDPLVAFYYFRAMWRSKCRHYWRILSRHTHYFPSGKKDMVCAACCKKFYSSEECSWA